MAPIAVWGQPQSGKYAESTTRGNVELKPGVVVEDVIKGSDAEKMGFASGDVILSWVRGEQHGLIESPFDLLEVEIEELPHGAVTLEGLGATVAKSWVWPSPVAMVQEGKWGLAARPNFTGSLLAGYQAGEAAAAAGKKAEAGEKWQATAAEAEQQHLPGWVAGWLRIRSAKSSAQGTEPNLPDQVCQQAVQSAKGDNSTTTKLLRACGDVFLDKGADEQAQTYYRQALANLENSKPASLSTASILIAMARSAFANDDVNQAVAFVKQALQIQEQLIPESLIVASNLNRIGVFLQSTVDLNQSKDYLLRSIALREKLSPHSAILATSLKNLGSTFVMLGDPYQAEPYHLRALKLYEETRPDSTELAMCYVDLANGAGDRGELAKGEEYYRKALDIQKKLQPRSGVTAASLNNLGAILQERGQLAAAEKFFRQSLEIKQERNPGSVFLAQTLSNLGDLLAERGDLAQAEKYLGESLTILLKKDPGNTMVAEPYIGLGNVAFQRQNIAQAEEYYRKALAIDEAAAPNARETGDILQRLGDAAWKRGDAAEAEKNYLRALKIRENAGPSLPGYADAVLALAQIAQGRRQWDLAERRFEQGLEALERQSASLGGTDEMRADFRAQHRERYRAYVDLLLAQNQTERAFDVLERSRARTLLETLTTAHVDVRGGADAELVERERSLQTILKAKSERRIRLLEEKHAEEQVKALEKEISDLTSEYQDVEVRLRSSSPGYAALTQPQPLTAKEIQDQLLDQDTLLLEYSLGKDRSYAFTLSHESLHAYELPPQKEIEEAARRLYELLTAQNQSLPKETETQRRRRLVQAEALYNQAAVELSRMILAPLSMQLKNKRLLVVADGALHYIPFAALPEPAAIQAASNPRRVPLTLNHEIVNLPSASVLAVLRQQASHRQPAPKAVVVLADPVFIATDSRVKASAARSPTGSAATQPDHPREQNDGSALDFSAELVTRSAADVGVSRSERLQLPRLLFSRREAVAIMAVTPDGLGMKAVDFDANREMATSPELAKYRMVHFATHGLLDSQHPELSGLVLSLVDKQGRAQDGFLQLEDIYNLNLPADLVVLSACETGLGKEISGEGLIGLTRGFMYAGATRVVSSLWKVEDFATAKLMKAFYTSMERGGKRPAEALREAQLSLLNDQRWSSPYYWAGFTIQGEWK